jgi:hypothetical protein
MKTENGSKPAYPDPMRGAEQSISNQTPEKLGQGLTKREMFAMAAMQGLCGPEYQASESHSYDKADRVARQAVRLADELLKHLES